MPWCSLCKRAGRSVPITDCAGRPLSQVAFEEDGGSLCCPLLGICLDGWQPLDGLLMAVWVCTDHAKGGEERARLSRLLEPGAQTLCIGDLAEFSQRLLGTVSCADEEIDVHVVAEVPGPVFEVLTPRAPTSHPTSTRAPLDHCGWEWMQGAALCPPHLFLLLLSPGG